ncbi:MAG: hypothetical protein MZV70_14030 [Desulfobacterales bacterium]|nr:hypothetical protein [Desulfobacterales bacterium]
MILSTSAGYSSRSEGIRDAIRTYITYYKWMSDVKGEREGVITMVYDHDQRGLLVTLTDIQHEFHAHHQGIPALARNPRSLS